MLHIVCIRIAEQRKKTTAEVFIFCIVNLLQRRLWRFRRALLRLRAERRFRERAPRPAATLRERTLRRFVGERARGDLGVVDLRLGSRGQLGRCFLGCFIGGFHALFFM